MQRREFLETITAGARLGATVAPAHSLLSSAAPPPAGQPATWPAGANYTNNRAPLLPTKYVKLPLGANRPAGWLQDQLRLQANGLTSRLGELWDVVKYTGWNGEAGRNVAPECCTPRFVPRWLEGITALAGVLHDDRLRAVADPYMQFLLNVKDPATVAPSVTAWSHLGRALPEYYELTGDPRALKLARTILNYADSVHTSKDQTVVAPLRLGMVLSYAWWYYNQTGDSDIPALVERCAKDCVENWRNYYVTFPNDPKYFVKFPDVTAQKHPGQYPSAFSRHVVDVTQAIQYPILYYLMSKNESDRASVIQGIANLDLAYGQIGARWNGDEWLANTDPTHGSELCSIEELLYSFEKNFEATGELDFADRIEQLMFNGFPGTCTADMWAHQYDQQANQVLVSVARRQWFANGDSSNIYGFTPNFPCCLSNMHSPWPRYIEYMWQATADKGLVAAFYGPCRLQAKVGDGASVEIVEETDYPFSDTVRISVSTDKPVSFPLYFRIPVWAEAPEVSVPGGGGLEHPQKGTLFKVERIWKSGDTVSLKFGFRVRAETRRRNNAASIAWGPLYFALRIGAAFEKLPGIPMKRRERPNAELIVPPAGCVDWRIAPTTDWNYALVIDRQNPKIEMVTGKISSVPFAQRGEPIKAGGAQEFTPWQEDVPIVLKARAKQVPEWGMDGANAGPVPVSPVKTDSPETVVELVPYGCTRLRISEFPTV